MLDINVASVYTAPTLENAGNSAMRWKPAAIVGGLSRAGNVIVRFYRASTFTGTRWMLSLAVERGTENAFDTSQ